MVGELDGWPYVVSLFFEKTKAKRAVTSGHRSRFRVVFFEEKRKKQRAITRGNHPLYVGLG
jgi:hypothetical protein